LAFLQNESLASALKRVFNLSEFSRFSDPNSFEGASKKIGSVSNSASSLVQLALWFQQQQMQLNAANSNAGTAQDGGSSVDSAQGAASGTNNSNFVNGSTGFGGDSLFALLQTQQFTPPTTSSADTSGQGRTDSYSVQLSAGYPRRRVRWLLSLVFGALIAVLFSAAASPNLLPNAPKVAVAALVPLAGEVELIA